MADRKLHYTIVGFAALAVIGSGLGLYFKLSSRTDVPPAAAVARPAAPNGSPAAPTAAAPSLEVAADRLAQRLRANDGTGDDWALLARSYAQMRRYSEAVEAFGRALQKMPGDKALIEEQAAARKAAGDAAPSK